MVVLVTKVVVMLMVVEVIMLMIVLGEHWQSICSSTNCDCFKEHAPTD